MNQSPRRFTREQETSLYKAQPARQCLNSCASAHLTVEPGAVYPRIALRFYYLFQREWLRLVGGTKRRKDLIQVAVLGCAATTVILFFNFEFPQFNWGKILFRASLVAALYFSHRASLGLAAELAEDRQAQLLAFIFLTGTRARDLFLSRLSARALTAIYGMLAVLPCCLVSILYGGITLQVCLAALLFFPTAVIFFIACEFLGAAVKTEPGAAEQFAGRTKLIALALPWAIDRFVQIITGAPVAKWIYLFSPVHAAWSIWEGLPLPWDFSETFVIILITLFCSAVALAVSGWILDRSWQEDTLLRSPRELLSRANRAWAAKIRPLLETAPMLWLAAFDQTALLYAWTSVGLILALWILGLAIWKSDLLLPILFYLTPLLMIGALRTQMLLRPARRMAKRRRDGELEVLLTTPQEPNAIVSAEFDALSLQFKPVFRCVQFLTIAFLIGATVSHRWQGPDLWSHGIVSLFLIWLSSRRPLGGIALYQWIGLNTGRGSGLIFRRAGGSVLGGGWSFYNVFRLNFGFLRNFPTGWPVEIAIALVLLVIFLVLIESSERDNRKYRDLTQDHLRDIAQSPLPAAEVLKSWDRQKPLVSV